MPPEGIYAMSRTFARSCSVVVLALIASVAHAQVYKCTDPSGKTVYSDTACDASAVPHKLPNEPMKGSGTNPRVCDQLLDETRRLAQEAERTVARGGKESAESLQRRQKVNRQYEQRCVSISRTGTEP